MRFSLAVGLMLAASGCGGSEATTVTTTVTVTAGDPSTATEAVETSRDAYWQTSYEGIETPSKNIVCIVALEQGYSWLRCQIREFDNPPPKRPESCVEGEWGQIVQMGPDSSAAWECSGEFFGLGPDEPSTTLAYGKTWRRGAFECRSRPTGLRCTNRFGYGLFLSRERQTFFGG
jgi:hypothetical protein